MLLETVFNEENVDVLNPYSIDLINVWAAAAGLVDAVHHCFKNF